MLATIVVGEEGNHHVAVDNFFLDYIYIKCLLLSTNKTLKSWNARLLRCLSTWFIPFLLGVVLKLITVPDIVNLLEIWKVWVMQMLKDMVTEMAVAKYFSKLLYKCFSRSINKTLKS